MQLALLQRLAPQVVSDRGRRVVSKAWTTGIVLVSVGVRPCLGRSSSCSCRISSSMVRHRTIDTVVDFYYELVSACSDCRRNQGILILLVEV